MRLLLGRFLFSLFVLLQWQQSWAAVCQSDTLCTHSTMPIWSQSDAPWWRLNGTNPTLLEYVQQRNSGNPKSDPGWCGGVSSAVMIKTYGNEVTALGCPITGTYSWFTNADPNVVIYSTFGLVGTGITNGGTSMGNNGNPGHAMQTIYGGQIDQIGMPSVDNFRNRYQRPLIEIGVCIQNGDGCHALTVHGTDGQFHILADPWGSTYDVTVNKYDTISGDTTITYIGNESGGGGSMIHHYGPTVDFISFWAFTTSSYLPQAPTITSQPTNQTAAQGASVTFSVQASGNPTYQWMFNGANILGATSSSYTLNSAQPSNAGSYQVKVSTCAGTVTSSTAVLQVADYSLPVITLQPSGQTVNEGGSVTLNVQANGKPTPTYQWQFNGSNISGATSPSLSLNAVTRSQDGNYQAVVSNSVGSVTSNVAHVTVNYPPTFSVHPTNQAAVAGSTVTFISQASGSPTPTYQWQLNDVDIAGANSSSLTLPNVQMAQQGTYKVKATNSLGSATSNSAVLSITSAPVFTLQPVNQSVIEGQSVTISAQVTGNPSPTLQWKKNGFPVDKATSTSLSFSNINRKDQGIYQLEAKNSAGIVLSNSASIEVKYLPEFILQPSSLSVNEGQTVTFNSQASGNPAPVFQWKWNGADLSAATSAVYSIPNVNRSRAGRYQVVVSNTVGSVASAEATLTINYKPEFTRQPPPFIVPAGSAPFILSVQVGGNPAPQLQWYQNGIPIPGATTYSLNLPLSSNQSVLGTYFVSASNANGTIQSTLTKVTTTPDQPTSTLIQNSGQTEEPLINTSAGTYHFYQDHGIQTRLRGVK